MSLCGSAAQGRHPTSDPEASEPVRPRIPFPTISRVLRRADFPWVSVLKHEAG
jgi:hypothetical protein